MERLLLHLGHLDVRVCEHSSSPPDPWAGYRRALADLPDVSHVLVIQDDALPVPGFAERLPELAQDVPVCLFLGGMPKETVARALRAAKKDISFVPLGMTPFVPIVAVLWPKPKLDELIAWAEKNPRVLTRADDGNLSKWMRRTRQQFLVVVPSLVDHDDDVPSVKGGREARGESWRKAALLSS